MGRFWVFVCFFILKGTTLSLGNKKMVSSDSFPSFVVSKGCEIVVL